jgi:hypothetical protein
MTIEKKLREVDLSMRILTGRAGTISDEIEKILIGLVNQDKCGSGKVQFPESAKFQFPEFIYGLLVGAGFIFLLAAAAWPHH